MRRFLASAAVVAPAVAGATPAAAVGPPIAAGPGSLAAGYTTPAAAGQSGGEMTFVNGDFAPHDVVSVDRGPNGLPLFYTQIVGLGERTPVIGLDNLEGGRTYAFFCSLHPDTMRGTLVVLPRS
ncbi:MAG TPA: hypothetical protein VNE62_05340 [Actinomycetota bacterium]|nr:hypothetical protein [Actinomycetota bacterium]